MTTVPDDIVNAETAPQTAAELQVELAATRAELAAARQEVATFHAAKAALADEEVLILKKMDFGLTRSQATAVVRRQIAFDNSNFGRMQRAKFQSRQSYLTHV